MMAPVIVLRTGPRYYFDFWSPLLFWVSAGPNPISVTSLPEPNLQYYSKPGSPLFFWNFGARILF